MFQLDAGTSRILQRGIRRGFTTLFREPRWKTTLGSLLGICVLVQALLMMLVGAQGAQSLLRTRTDLRLEVEQGATPQYVQEFFSALQNQPYIEEAAYITKEQAYGQAREHDPELIAFIEEFQMGNPFPDTIGVTLRSLDDYQQFRSFIEEAHWNGVVDPAFLSEVTDQERQVEELLRFTRAGSALTTLILVLVGAVLLFIIIELVRRRVLERRNDIVVEKVVGASPLSMFLPFATEASVLLFIGTVLSMLLALLLLWQLPLVVPALGDGGILASLSREVTPRIRAELPLFFLLELLLVPLIACGGTWLGMMRELTQRTLSLSTN